MQRSEVLPSGRLILQLVVLFTVVQVIEGKCLWYERYHGSTPNGREHNLRYEGDAKLITDEGKELLMEYCPHMVALNETCCSNELITGLNRGIDLMSIAFNREKRLKFAKALCEYTCSPFQNSFMRIRKSTTVSKDKEYIDAIDVYIKKQYLEETFKYLLGSSGWDGFKRWQMCGAWSANWRGCYDYLGNSASNSRVPFDIGYMTEDNDMPENMIVMFSTAFEDLHEDHKLSKL